MSKDNFLLNKLKIFGIIFVMLFLLCALLPLGGALSIEAKSMESEMTNSVEVESDENTLVSSSGADVLYIDPESKYGGADTNDGLSADTPIQTLDRAKELVSPTGSIYIMSTFYITEDTVVDMNSTDVTFKRYKPEDPTIFQNEEWYNDGVTFFEGDVFVIGDESDDSISPTVVFDNFTFDGEHVYFSPKVDDESYQTFLIRNYNSNVVLEKGIKVLNIVRQTTTNRTFGAVYSSAGYVVVNGSSFIDASGTDRYFHLVNSSNMIINDIVVNVVYTASGVIYVTNSYLTVNGGDFYGLGTNENSGHYLFYLSNGRLVINQGEFHDFTGNSGVIGIPGFSQNNFLVINGGRFYNNKITSEVSVAPVVTLKDGGAIINGGIFENNSNVNGGGVIAINGAGGNLIVNGGVFRNNTSACGGAIYCNLIQDEEGTRTANLVVRNAEFIGNSVVGGFTPSEAFTFDYGNGQTIIDGGAIVCTQNLIIENCTFEDNMAEGSGGAIFLGGNNNQILQISNSNFIRNESQRNANLGGGGGAIFASNFSTNSFIKNCWFDANSSLGYGAAVTSNESHLVIENCSFANHKKGIFIFRSRGNFLNCKIYDNSMPRTSLFDHYGIYFKNCIIENNVALRIIQLQGRVCLNNTIIKNNVVSEGAIVPENGNDVMGRILLIGNNYVYGNRSDAQLDESGCPLVENSKLVGGVESNIVINGTLTGRDTQDDFVIYNIEGSCFGISFAGEDNTDILNGVEPAVYFGEDSPVNSEVLNCLVSDDPNYEFEFRDGAIYLKQVGGLTGSIVYTASDTYVPYDGREHGIGISVVAPANATIRYRTNEAESFTNEEPKFTSIGSYTVYFEISASGYATIEGSRKVEITKNETGLIDFVPINSSVTTPITTVQLYYGESLTTSTDLTDRVKGGVILDQNGNSVYGTFTSQGTYNVTFDTESISVKFTPTNTEAYEGCTFTARVEFKYDELYFINGAFYLNADATGVSIPKSVGLNKILSYMSSQGKIYFSDTYEVTSSETIATDKLIYLYRYTWYTSGIADEQVFTGEIFNISSRGNLTIGGKNRTDGTVMLGKIIIDGQGYATAGSTNALIVNDGKLTVYGGLEIKGGYNINSIGPVTPGGAIYNTATMNLYDVYISDCRYLNYVASTQFSGGGGGIFNTGTLRYVGGSINTCLARGGGAIYSEGDLHVVNTTFVDNSAYSGTQVGTSSSSGMTIKLANGEANLVNILITRSRISNSTTYYDHTSSNMTNEKIGGGIYVGVNASLVLVSSNLAQCYAYQGGGVYVDGSAHIFDSMVSSCYTTNGGEGVAVGTQGELTVVDLFIARCSSTNTPDGSLGTNENGILTLTGGNTSLLSLSFEAGEGLNGNTNKSGENNQDYVLGVILAVVTLVLISSILLILSTKSKKAKVRLKK